MSDPSPAQTPTAPAPRPKVFSGPIKACPRWDLPALYMPMANPFVASFTTNRTNVQYTIAVTGDTGGATVVPPSLTPDTDGTQVLVTLPNVAGVYYLEIGPTTALGYPHAIQVLFNPMMPGPLAVNISGNPPPGTYPPHTQVVLTAAATGGTPPYNYQWRLGMTPLGNEQTLWVALDTPGSMYGFSVTVTDSSMPQQSALGMVGYGTTT